MVKNMKYSIIIPIYKNESSILRLLSVLENINEQLNRNLEVIFVVDGSPDNSFAILRNSLCNLSYNAQLIALSRNFGASVAVFTGLKTAGGDYFAIMAADLQEPPSLITDCFLSLVKDECDVAIGIRRTRQDPFLSKLLSGIFWWLYRKTIDSQIPAGGVDAFACNKLFRDNLISLNESRSSLVALLFWLGFRRKFIPYDRLARKEGKSAWTFRKKVDYMMDSVFAFTDLPIKLLLRLGMIGLSFSLVLGVLTFAAKITGFISVPGYAATILIVLFFGALNTLGLGLVGNYAWRGYENTKQRPMSVVAMKLKNETRENDYQ